MMDYLKELYEIEKEYYIKLPNDIRECHYAGLRYKDRLSNYIEFNIERIADFSECKKTEGVYMIDELYIGKSKNIKRRIAQHLEESLFDIDRWNPATWLPIVSENKEKANYLSYNVGSGELWNRTEFFNKIVETLLDVADTVQKDILKKLKV